MAYKNSSSKEFLKYKNNSNKLVLIALLAIVAALITFNSTITNPSQQFVTKAVVDIGSGSTKLTIANVAVNSNSVHEVLHQKSYNVPYQQELAKSKNNSFNEKIMQQGLSTFAKIKNTAASYGTTEIVGIATASFRSAINAKDYINIVEKETGIKVHIVSQATEAKLAHLAATDELKKQGHIQSEYEHLVWDIGGGSLQLIAKAQEDDSYVMHLHTEAASVPFKNHVIKNIKKQNPNNTNTPNPLSSNHISLGLEHANTLCINTPDPIKCSIQKEKRKIISVGDLFNKGIVHFMQKNKFTRDELAKRISEHANLHDVDLDAGGFEDVYLTNAILVLGFMEGLDIEDIYIININTAQGAFLIKDLWNN